MNMSQISRQHHHCDPTLGPDLCMKTPVRNNMLATGNTSTLLHFQDPVPQWGTCTFLAVTCATSPSLSFQIVLSTTEASCSNGGRDTFWNYLSVSLYLYLFLLHRRVSWQDINQVRSEVMVLEHSFFFFLKFVKQWWWDRSLQTTKGKLKVIRPTIRGWYVGSSLLRRQPPSKNSKKTVVSGIRWCWHFSGV